MYIAGASIIACRGTGRHVVALEKDRNIFELLLKPMKKEPSVLTATQAPVGTVPGLDLDAVPVVPMVFNCRVRPSK